MRIRRTISPVAAAVSWEDIWNGVQGLIAGRKDLERVEGEIKEYFGIRHVFLVSSGKAALYLVLKALKTLSPERNRVVIPAYTCYSVPSAVVKAGLKIVPCDIDPQTFDFNYERLNEIIDDDTLCVLPIHLFGVPADMERTNAVCHKRDIFVVEDAAQAMGATVGGKKLGTLGDAGFFSLGRGKSLTCGSGGIIVTNSDQIANAINVDYEQMKYPGMAEEIKELLKIMVMAVFIRPRLYWLPSGLPFLKLGHTFFHKDFTVKRMSGMKAGLLRMWKEHLLSSAWTRRTTSEWFIKRLQLSSHRRILPYLRLPVLAESKAERDRIYAASRAAGAGLSIMYPAPINEIEEIKDSFQGKKYPVAKDIAERLLTLPTHHLLSIQDREKISSMLSSTGIRSSSGNDFFKKKGRKRCAA